MAEISEYDEVNNPGLSEIGPGKPAKETPIKVSKPVNKGPQLSEYNTSSESNTFEVHTGSPEETAFKKNEGEYVVGTNLNEQRANRQSGLENVFSGLAKGTGLLGTTVASLVTSLPEGIIRATAGAFDPNQTSGEAFSKLYDNYSADKLNQFNEFMEKSFPNYYSEAEQRETALQGLNNSNFWGDKVLKNAGFTVGAIIGGKGLSSLGKIATGAKYLQNAATVESLVAGGMEASQAAKTVATGIKFADKAQQLATGMIMSTGEAGMEAKQVKDELLESLLGQFRTKNGRDPDAQESATINRTASAAGNTTFAVNMAVLTASDTYQFGKLWAKGFKEEVDRVGKIALEEGVFKAVKPSIKSRVGKSLLGSIPNALSEAAEEGIQTGTQAGAKEYYQRKYDKKGLTDTNDMISGMLSGLEETFGTKNGIESMLLGAVTGIGSHSVISGLGKIINSNNPSEYENALQAASRLNSANAKIKPFIESYTRGVSLEKDSEGNLLSEQPSRLIHENISHDRFKNIIQPYIETGRFDLLEEKLNDELQKDEEQFKKDNGNTSTRKTGKEYVSKLLKDAKQLKNNWDNIQESMPKSSPTIKNILWSITSDIANRNNRADVLNLELQAQSGVNYDSSKTAEQYLDEIKAISEIRPVDNNGQRIDYSKANDIVALREESKAKVEQYKQLLNPQIQEQIIADDEIKEEQVKAFEPEVITSTDSTQEEAVQEPQATASVDSMSETEIIQPESNSEVIEPTVDNIEAPLEVGISKEAKDIYNNALESIKGLVAEDGKKVALGVLNKELANNASSQDNEAIVALIKAVEEDNLVELTDEQPQSKSVEDLTDTEIVANNDAVEDILSEVEDDEPILEDTQSDYSEMNLMSATLFRSTQDHAEAIKEGLNSVLRYQNFINNPNTSLVGLKLMVINDSNPLYNKLQNKKQKGYKGGVMAVVVNSSNELAIADASGDIVGYVAADNLSYDIDDATQGVLISPLAKITSKKDSGFNAVSYQHFGRINGFGDEVDEKQALDEKTEVGKAWAKHVQDLNTARENMLNGKIKFLSITGSSPGIFQNNGVSNNVKDVLGDINNPQFKYIIPITRDINRKDWTKLDAADGVNKEQWVRIGRPHVIYNGRVYPLSTRNLNSTEIKSVLPLLEDAKTAYKSGDKGLVTKLVKQIKEVVYIDKQTLTSILKGINGYNNVDNLKEYLSNKFRQVDANKLANSNEYRDLLFTGNNPVLTINFNPHPTNTKMSPNFLNGYLEYSPIEDISEVVSTKAEEQVSIKEVVDKPKSKGKKVYKPIIIEEDGELLRRVSLATSNKKEDIATVKKWFEDRFNGESFEVVDKLINGNGFGEYTAAGIKLFEGAEEGTGYHEAFHKVTQEYLTPKQLKSLYDDVRNSINKNFSDYQAEEYLAEDFRNFMLSDQKAIKGRPITNNIFRKLYNFLKSLFTGKTTPEQIYNKLASKKGYTGAKKFNVQQFNRLGRAIPGLTHQQTNNIVESINSHFFNVLFESKKTPDQILGDNGAELVRKAYGIVFKRLVSRDFAALVRDADEYNDEEYNAITDHYDFLLNINEEGEPTSLNQEAIKAHKDYLKGLGIYLGKSVGIEEEDTDNENVDDTQLTGEETDRSKAEWKNANEDSTIYSTPNSIKLLVMSLPEIDSDGNPTANKIGGPKLNDYNQTIKLLYANLNGLSQFHEMWSKLEELAPRFPVFRQLMNRLGEPGSTKSLEQFLLENDFRQAFSKFESRGTITLINPENGEIFQVDANANKLRDRIKENWISDLRASSSNSKYVTKSDDGLLHISGDILTDKLSKKQFLNALGITFTDLTEDEVTATVSNNIINNIKAYVKTLVDENLPVDSLWKPLSNKDKKNVSITGRMNELLDIESEISKETVELSYISAEGKRIYAVSLNNYYSLIVNAFNNAKSRQDLFEKYPHLDNPYTKNSVWLKSMFNKDGSKVSGNAIYMNTVSGLKINGDNDSGKGATKMEPSDKIVQEINDLLGKGTSSLIRAADKSSEYAPGIKKYSNGELLAIPLESIKENGFQSSEVHEIFMGYFNDELARIRQFLGAEGTKRVGNNIAIYNKQAANFSLFADILSPETLEELQSYKESYEELSTDLEAKISQEIVNYLESYSADTKAYIQARKVGIKYAKGFTGINPEFTGKTEKGLDDAIKAFTVNHLVNMIEQSKLLVGDSAFYKDKIKRISAGTSGRKFGANSTLVDNWLNNFYKNEVGRVDGKVADGKLNVVIFDDVKAYQDNIEDYIDALEKSGMSKEVARETLKDYAQWNEKDNKWESPMDEGDAQGWITLDEYREFMMRVGGSYWTAEHEAQYRYEIALERGEEGLTNPNFYFMPIKAQHFGPQVMDGLYAPAFHKYSLAPLYMSLVKGRNMEKLLTDMRANKVGYALFGSGSKVGTPLDNKSKLPQFYDNGGNMSGITDNTPTQQIHYEFLGIQLDIAPKVKDKIIFGSQTRKLLFSNVFGENTKPEFTKLAEEYNKLIDEGVNEEFGKLTKRLGISYKGDGSFTFKGDYKKLVEQLRESLEDKDTADNILDSLQTNEDGSLVYSIDSMVNRPKIESMLFSIVNNKVIKQKMNGNSLVQLASSGFEAAGKREIGKSNYLKFYTNKGKNGATTAMEVEIPMNANFSSLLDKYNGDLNALNKAISEGRVNSKALTMIGYRIPTQGLNSMDVMTIKRFMPETSGIAIILPTGVVAKSGGDYDIDKLNIFMPSSKKDEKSVRQNRIIEIMSEVLTHPDNFIELTTPNTVAKLKDIVKNIRQARGQNNTDTASQTRQFRFDYLMDQFDVYLGGKAALGIAATHNTHHILSQIAKVELNIEEKDFPFKANFTGKNTVDKKQYIRDLYKVAISQLDKDEVAKLLSVNKVKQDITQESKEDYLYEKFSWLFDGDKDEIKNIQYSITEKAINENYSIALDNFDGNKEAAQIDTTIANRIAKGVIEMYDGSQNFNSDKSKLFLGGVTTQSGAKISDINNQFINAYVDVAKDPFYKDLNAGTEVSAVWMYLLRAGVDEYTIGYFMAQPIIQEYVNARKLNKSLIVKSNNQDKVEYYVSDKSLKQARLNINSKNKDISDKAFKILNNGSIYNDILEKYGVDYKLTQPDFSYDGINQKLLKYIKEGANNNDLSRDFKEAQTQFLKAFIQIEKQSGELTKLMQVTNSDTKTTRSFGSAFNESRVRSEVESSAIIPKGTADRIRKQTIVGSFDKGQQISQLFKELTMYMSKPEINAGLNILINNIDKKLDYEKEYMKIQNDFIGYLTQLYGKTLEGKPLYSKIDLLSGDNSLAKQLIQFNKEGLLEDNPFVKELIAVIAPKSNEIDNIKMYSRRMSAFESNVYTEAFRELLDSNDPRIQEFGRDLAYLTMLQSGLNNSPITFTELIPFEFYGNIVKGALNSADNIDMNDFIERFNAKKVSPYGFRLQDFGLDKNLPKINGEQIIEDKVLPIQGDSNVDIAETNPEILNSVQDTFEFEGNTYIKARVEDYNNPPSVFKVGNQQAQINQMNNIANKAEEDGSVDKICKI